MNETEEIVGYCVTYELGDTIFVPAEAAAPVQAPAPVIIEGATP